MCVSRVALAFTVTPNCRTLVWWQVWYTEKTGLDYKVCTFHADTRVILRVLRTKTSSLAPKRIANSGTALSTVPQVCDGSGEDPTCADSVSVVDFSVADHLVYAALRLAYQRACTRTAAAPRPVGTPRVSNLTAASCHCTGTSTCPFVAASLCPRCPSRPVLPLTCRHHRPSTTRHWPWPSPGGACEEPPRWHNRHGGQERDVCGQFEVPLVLLVGRLGLSDHKFDGRNTVHTPATDANAPQLPVCTTSIGLRLDNIDITRRMVHAVVDD